MHNESDLIAGYHQLPRAMVFPGSGRNGQNQTVWRCLRAEVFLTRPDKKH